MISEAVPVTFRKGRRADRLPRTGRHSTTPKPCPVGGQEFAPLAAIEMSPLAAR
jgi:hypothetical protein